MQGYEARIVEDQFHPDGSVVWVERTVRGEILDREAYRGMAAAEAAALLWVELGLHTPV